MTKKRILGTFDFGMLLPRIIEILSYFSLVGLAFILALDIVVAILHFSVVYIGLIPLLLICLAFFLWIISCQIRHKKLIANWIQDAVEIEASLTEIIPFNIAPTRNRNEMAFQIRFTFDGKQIVLATNTNDRQLHTKGMLKMYKPLRSLMSNKLSVLYSPTNNKVIFYK